MRTYRLDASAARIAEALGADAGQDQWLGGSVEPGGYAPVVISGPGGVRHMVPRQWGVPPPPSGNYVVTHVRNLASPFWIGTLRHTQFRCLVPVTAFPSGEARFARPSLTDPSYPIFAVAGIWRDSEVPSFAILTREAGGGSPGSRSVALPVIVPVQQYGFWLNADWKLAQHMVKPER